MQRSLVLLVLAVVLAACTTGASDPAPERPSTTPPMATPDQRVDPVGRVAVVLDPRLQARGEAVDADLQELDPEVAGGRTLRVEVAEDPSFVHDLAQFFANDGHELVCVLGPGAAGVVREVAARSPGTRFCAAPAGRDGDDFPDNVLAVDVRIEELAYLAGVALGADHDVGPVAALTGRASDTPAARVRSGLQAGLRAAGLRAPELVVAPLPPDPEAVTGQIRGLLDEGVRGLLGLVHGELVVEVATGTPVTTPVPTPAPTDPGPSPTSPAPRYAGVVLRGPLAGDGPLPPEVLAVVEVHLHEAVVVALRRHLEDWDPSATSIGVAEGAIVAVPNDRSRSSGATEALARATTALRSGEAGLAPPTEAASPS